MSYCVCFWNNEYIFTVANIRFARMKSCDKVLNEMLLVHIMSYYSMCVCVTHQLRCMALLYILII